MTDPMISSPQLAEISTMGGAEDDGRQIPGSRRQAVQTRRAISPRIQPLAPAGSRPSDLALSAAAARVGPDSSFAPRGRARLLVAYDAGLPPPPLPPDASGDELAQLDIGDTIAGVLDRLTSPLELNHVRRGVVRRRCEQLLGWLAGFDGTSWEQRWLASGADSAPRSWAAAAFPDAPQWRHAAAVGAAYDLIHARALRPSYAWLLLTRPGRAFGHFLQVNAATQLELLRALPAYQQALLRHRFDAEHCLARVMIRTGKPLTGLQGEDLLAYADLVRASGRSRREHLAWELMVALGVFVDEPATLRAAWSAKGNTRQHSVTALVDRYGIPPGGVRDLLVDYLSEVKPGIDYASLEGLAYRLIRLFWWEILQINPDQADLCINSTTATAWRERFAITTDGRPRREQQSTFFAIRAFYRDLAEWSHNEPARWGIWVAPCPIPRTQWRAASTAKRHQQARTQARSRVLTPRTPPRPPR